jgi:SAM-dependent methyltransferase
MTVQSFYDELASRYHLIYEDWDASIDRQGAALDALLREHFPERRDIFDVAIGIGTQSLGLSVRGYHVIGSDLSSGAVRRAATEAMNRSLTIPVSVADFRALPIGTASTDIVLCGDNSLPHVLSADAILDTLREWHRCLKPGGGCLISMRDYGDPPVAGTVEERPYGERIWKGRRYGLRQVWTWHGPRYEVALEMTAVDGDRVQLPVSRSSYLAIPVLRVKELMNEAGFVNVERVDGRFFQPVLIGHVSGAV